MRLSISVIHCGCGWLLARNDDEFLAGWCPLDVLNLVVKYWDEVAILAFVNSHVLERVFSVVALSR
jgi:hypothetical protein